MSIEVAQLAWMAGVVDLKGKITYKKNKTRATTKQVTLYVESVQKPIVDKLARATGTSPELKTRRPRWEGWYRKGCEEHCPEQHIHVAGSDFLPAARWTLSGAAMAVVLTNLKPYIVQDKGFSEAVEYAFGNMVLYGQGAGMTVTALRRLHALGWELPDLIYAQRPTLTSGIAANPGELETVT
jgi:hypothetical protein